MRGLKYGDLTERKEFGVTERWPHVRGGRICRCNCGFNSVFFFSKQFIFLVVVDSYMRNFFHF